MKYYLTYLLFFFSSICNAQVSFTNAPEEAQFITTDINLFWQQFDLLDGSYEVMTQIDQMKACYQNLKKLYEEAVFPPAYFVIGAFNSGGTSTSNGLIMGVEMQQDISKLPYIVAH